MYVTFFHLVLNVICIWKLLRCLLNKYSKTRMKAIHGKYTITK